MVAMHSDLTSTNLTAVQCIFRSFEISKVAYADFVNLSLGISPLLICHKRIERAGHSHWNGPWGCQYAWVSHRYNAGRCKNRYWAIVRSSHGKRDKRRRSFFCCAWVTRGLQGRLFIVDLFWQTSSFILRKTICNPCMYHTFFWVTWAYDSSEQYTQKLLQSSKLCRWEEIPAAFWTCQKNSWGRLSASYRF